LVLGLIGLKALPGKDATVTPTQWFRHNCGDCSHSPRSICPLAYRRVFPREHLLWRE